jgi:hypothetical protein
MRAVKAKYVKRSVCDCGFPTLEESVPLGKVYTVYPDSVSPGAILCGGCGSKFPVKFIDADDVGGRIGALPLDIFELDEGLAA